MGVDCFKTDFGERIPDTGVTYHDGSDPVEMHNLYPLQYNEAVYDLTREVRGDADAVVFARSAYASAQRFPVQLAFETTGGPPRGVRYNARASVILYTGENSVANALAWLWIRLIAALTYVS